MYLVSTPIGNLEDITLRALRVLKESSLVAAEDTRKTGQLLAKYGIQVPLCSFYEHSLPGQTEHIISRLETGDVAVVSEAGMPGISDPGYELVVRALERGVKIIPVPGPSAVTSAVAVSGLPTDRFLYMGFLPRRKADRQRVLAGISAQEATIVIFEAPHRLKASLNDIMLTLGNRHISVCREMTKLYEEVFRGSIEQAIEHFANPRGEFTLVIEGAGKSEPAGFSEAMMHRLAQMKRAGMKARDVVPVVAVETGLNRREIYQAWLNIDDK
ncbi:MAG: 16S rRNA (cytidine(1402)-2'-O)-methyltransferase [Dehalococcoidaceae bacterium]|nr:16S rRNA (cytidine(1402)-2'-O)-methyltransferase [Dehalococcoidaceae bacterium]